jgi:hypothetical protein
MPNSKLPSFTDISFLERLTKQNIFQLLFNLALYLSFVLPLIKQAQLPIIQSPWKNLSNEIALIFLLSGFGFTYWISGSYIRSFLISVRIQLEFWVKILLLKLELSSSNENSPMAIYVRNRAFLTKSDIVSYLSKTENKFLEKLYTERLEMDARFNLNKENTVVTLTLFSLHWYFKSNIYLSLAQYLPRTLPIVFLLFLLYSSAEPFPEGNDYFCVPDNPIRNPQDDKLS